MLIRLITWDIPTCSNAASQWAESADDSGASVHHPPEWEGPRRSSRLLLSIWSLSSWWLWLTDDSNTKQFKDNESSRNKWVVATLHPKHISTNDYKDWVTQKRSIKQRTRASIITAPIISPHEETRTTCSKRSSAASMHKVRKKRSVQWPGDDADDQWLLVNTW